MASPFLAYRAGPPAMPLRAAAGRQKAAHCSQTFAAAVLRPASPGTGHSMTRPRPPSRRAFLGIGAAAVAGGAAAAARLADSGQPAVTPDAAARREGSGSPASRELRRGGRPPSARTTCPVTGTGRSGTSAPGMRSRDTPAGTACCRARASRCTCRRPRPGTAWWRSGWAGTAATWPAGCGIQARSAATGSAGPSRDQRTNTVRARWEPSADRADRWLAGRVVPAPAGR